MRSRQKPVSLSQTVGLALLLSGCIATTAAPLGTEFTYQGRLSDAGPPPPNNEYDFRFLLWTEAGAGIVIPPTDGIPKDDQPVVNGLFTVKLDYGPVFQGDARYLEVWVRPGNVTGAFPATYTRLSPRQPLCPTPYALFSSNAPWSGLLAIPSGFADGVDNDTIYSAGAGLNLIGTVFSVNFAGSGAASTAARSDHHHDGRYWNLLGNAGTVPGTHFLGTVDNQPLQLRANNVTGLTLFPAGPGANVLVSTRLGIATLVAPGYPLHVNGDARIDGTVFVSNEDVALYRAGTGRTFPGSGSSGWIPNISSARGVWLESAGNESGGFYADGDVAVIWSPGDPDLLRVYDEDDLPGGAPKFVINGSGYVGVLTPNPLSPLHVAGQFLRVDGAGGEAAYLGGDGAGNDVQVGSLNPLVGNVALFNAASATYMNLVAHDVSYGGLLNKLDVADNFTATVRAADFTLGHSSRRGTPGRALVDFGGSLIVNFAADWPETIVNSRFKVEASDMFVGPRATGNFAGAAGFDFHTGVSSEGLIIEQAFPHGGSGGTESSGIYFDGDSITMWNPGDNNRLLRFLDEDGMIERFAIDGSGNIIANGVFYASSRRFKENVAPITGALDKILQLQGVTFDWVKDRGGKAGIGFIAEDVAKVLPELVEWEKDGKDAVGLQYANLSAVNVEAIKELKAQKDQEIECLKKINAALESRVAELEAKEKARESRLVALERFVQKQAGHTQEASFKNGGDQ